LSGFVSDQVSERMTVSEPHAEVACSLRGPWPGRVRGDTCEVNASGGVFDDEQNMETFQGRGVDACEVGGEDGFGP
jgi:hypothetical protein